MKKQFLLGLMAMTLPLTMWAQASLTLKVTPTDVTYAGDNTKSGIVVTTSDGKTELKEGTDYIVAYTRNDVPVQRVHDAGTYTGVITMMPESKYWNYTVPADADTKFTVNKLKVKGGVELNKTVQVQYTGQEITGEEEVSKGITVLSALVSGLPNVVPAKDRDNFLAGLKVVGFENKAIGPDVKYGETGELDGYGVQVIDNGNTDWSSNYIYEPASAGEYVALTIIPRELTVTFDAVTYDGTVKDVTTWTNANAKAITGLINQETTSLTFKLKSAGTGNTQPTVVRNADTYTLSVTSSNPNYSVKDATYKITKADLSIKKLSGNLAVTYPNAVPADLNKYFAYETLLGTDSKVDSRPSVADSVNVKTLLKLLMNIEGEATYGDEGYDVYPYVNGEKAVTKETKNGTVSYKDAGKLENYEIKYEMQQFYAWKKQLKNDGQFEFIWNDSVDMTYQGHDFVIPENIVKVVYKAAQDTLEYGKDYVVKQARKAETLARNAGEAFRIKIVSLPSSTCVKDSVEFEGAPYFTIVKAPLKIELADENTLMKVYDGENSGDLSEYFKFTTLLDEDATEEGLPAEGWLTLEAKHAGEKDKDTQWMVHLWTAEGMVASAELGSDDPEQGLKNYIVEYDYPKYTILASDFVLYGDDYENLKKENEEAEIVTNTAKLEKYAGLEVGEVTIKHVRSLKNAGFQFERYYSLALPFDVTPREISNAFGYAVVNIPNTNNTDENTLAFKLALQTIPANTMMLFRVDDVDGLIKPDSLDLVFTNKTIAKDLLPNSAYASDGGGHNFCVTYEAKELTEDNQYYWSPSTKNVGYVPAGGLLVNAFNGYFEFDQANNGVRILFEETDGSTTAINTITTEAVNNNGEGWYSIDGVKLNAQPTQKGVYINNGKKVVVK